MTPRLVTEVVEKKQQALIIEKRRSKISQLLKAKLSDHDIEIFYSPALPKNSTVFEFVFLIDEKPSYELLQNRGIKKLIVIFINGNVKAANLAHKANQYKNLKVINCSDNLGPEDLEKFLWFALSKSRENYLDIVPILTRPKQRPGHSFSKFLTKKNFLISFIAALFIFHISIFPMGVLSGYFLYQSLRAFQNEKISSSRKFLNYANFSNNLTKSIYSITRPSYLFLSFALYPDSLMTVNDKAQNLLENSLKIYQNASLIFSRILKKDKTPDEKSALLSAYKDSEKRIDVVLNDLYILDQKLPDFPRFKKIKIEVKNSLEFAKKSKKILPYLPIILAVDSEKKYLLLFANNMEIRPGGGFIGSFGILTMQDLTLSDLQIYDVYDADGQLTAHVDPPDAIRKHLGQSHWFLRDSAFSPDFAPNYLQAKFFLNQEMSLGNFAGGALLTTTAIQNALEAYGNIYLPNINEIINRDNFYIKAQTYSEQNFFPGSIQKKSFLGNLAKQLMLSLDTASFSKLATAFQRSLDEKQIVLNFEDSNIQSIIDSFYWSGKKIVPSCAESTTSCIGDYLFPLDANLGVNKANFYVNRTITQRINIALDGHIDNTLIINLKNESPNNSFPGGTYKDYFQLSLPKNSLLKSLTKNGVSIESYDEAQDELKTIGFLIEIPAQSQAELKISYRLPDVINRGHKIYQLVFQKQIGSKNSDLNLEMILPSNIKLLNQNFIPLVKDNRLFYNTSLSQDKIFVLEFQKQ